MNVVQLAHLVFCNVQYKPARFPTFQQRSTFIQDPLIRPKKYKYLDWMSRLCLCTFVGGKRQLEHYVLIIIISFWVFIPAHDQS